MLPKFCLQRVALALVAAAMLSFPGMAAAQSGEPITVKVNMARVLRINAPAATVIVGNPGVADVTIQDPKTLVLTGKSYGQTNLIVLDTAGNPIADTMIQVVQQQADLMTVYLGRSRTTLTCAPACQPTIMLGDDSAFSAENMSSSSIVAGAAQ
jgi:Flp pilus assembly secretin CpaC